MKIETPILRRLGPVPFWRGETKCLDELAETLPDRENQLDEILLRDLINRFVRALKKEERDIFVLRYTSVLTVEEICARTGRKQSAVKVSLYRTRKKLRGYLMERGYLT